MRIETFELERWMTTYETNVDYDIAESGIYPMTVQELIELTPESDQERLLRGLTGLRLGYSEACGSFDLRAELASTYANTTPDNVLVTTGAIEANYLLFKTLLEPGDHVVAVYPAYQQLYSVPRAIGCEVDLWKLDPEKRFRFDLDELEQLIRPTTKMIVINTPHNPTGSLLTEDELRRIYALAEANGIWILSDEAYRWLDLPGADALARPARDLGDRAISVGTVSKPFGLPGLRIGWLTAPEEVVSACWSMRDYISLSPGGLNDRLALIALRHRDRIMDRTRSIVEANLTTMDRWLDEHRGLVSWVRPRGGLLGLIQYQLDLPSYPLANRLAEEYSVMLAPGAAFGLEYQLRIGVGQHPETFAAGLDRTSACLRDLQAAGTGLREN